MSLLFLSVTINGYLSLSQHCAAINQARYKSTFHLAVLTGIVGLDGLANLVFRHIQIIERLGADGLHVEIIAFGLGHLGRLRDRVEQGLKQRAVRLVLHESGGLLIQLPDQGSQDIDSLDRRVQRVAFEHAIGKRGRLPLAFRNDPKRLLSTARESRAACCDGRTAIIQSSH